ncbi:hypothetical protein KY359_00865, partial [Candidatus Woesearchaeota archaeon]|nr:hypothetical protein [Candidatus Woesearchaeota archaeon]
MNNVKSRNEARWSDRHSGMKRKRMMMEIGIKIFPEDLAYAKKIVRYADFIEVTAIPGSNFRALKCLK